MENATKALIISAGVLFAIMIVSVAIISYNNFSNYLNRNEQELEVEQMAKFNSQFENYNRKNVRGSDILSLMSKIDDYNERYHKAQGTNYPKIRLQIDLVDASKYCYTLPNDDPKNVYLTQKLENYLQNYSNSNIEADGNIKSVIDMVKTQKIIVNGEEKIISEVQLQRLASNISNIIIPSREKYKTGSSLLNNETLLDQYKASNTKLINVVKEILGIELQLKGKNEYYEIKEKELIEDIEKITNNYYQLLQFKRAHFDCTAEEYDTNSGRIIYMKFEFNGTFG